MSEILINFIVWIYYMILGQIRDEYVYVSILGYVLIIIGCLVYNEIIICYVCLLSEYTKKQITKREKEEIKMSQELSLNLVLD